MKKFLIMICVIVFDHSYAQTTMKSVQDAKKIEVNKKEFIGKPLSYLLKNINLEIKSVQSYPNKKFKEINRITFRYISDYEYRKTGSKNINDRPTQLTVVFNQNWEFNGELCNNLQPQCISWTKDDERNLGNLIIYDIYVLGKD